MSSTHSTVRTGVDDLSAQVCRTKSVGAASPFASEIGAYAVSLGVTPFLVGDLIKLLLAGALLPAAWAAVDRTT
jgi:biotin transporter BioY